MTDAHSCPYWMSKPTQIGSPTIVGGCPYMQKWATKSCRIGYPILVRGRPKPSRIGCPLFQVAARFVRKWAPNPNVADRPDLWEPIVARGHAICNAWMRVGKRGRPYLCVGARMERAKKIPHSPKGSEADHLRV